MAKNMNYIFLNTFFIILLSTITQHCLFFDGQRSLVGHQNGDHCGKDQEELTTPKKPSIRMAVGVKLKWDLPQLGS